MATVPVTPSVVQDIVDNADERELWIVGREHEREPYFFPGKGGDTRLARALRVCVENRIMPNGDGSYTVEGSEKRTYRCAESCSCPHSQQSKSKWCYHMVAVALYVEWQRRLRGSAPVALGTLRPGTLPFPPVTVDARLAQAAAVAMDHVYDALPVPQEDRMPDEDAQYLPEPDTDHAPVATLEASDADFPPMGQRATPTLRPRAPQVEDLEAALQVWTTERAVVQRFLKQELKANIDYYTLRIGGKDSKPSLSKAGAEKVLGWLKIQASFSPDTGTWEMLGRPQDLLCYVCTLRTRSGEIVGEGRGARSLKKDGGDVNKAIKMAEKSSMVSAVLRTGALSDVFTQDLEDMQEEEGSKGRGQEGSKAAGSKERGEGRKGVRNEGEHSDSPLTPSLPIPSLPSQKPTGQESRQRIWAMVQAQAPDVTTREAVEAWIHQETGYVLHPDNYRDIIESLETRA